MIKKRNRGGDRFLGEGANSEAVGLGVVVRVRVGAVEVHVPRVGGIILRGRPVVTVATKVGRR